MSQRLERRPTFPGITRRQGSGRFITAVESTDAFARAYRDIVTAALTDRPKPCVHDPTSMVRYRTEPRRFHKACIGGRLKKGPCRAFAAMLRRHQCFCNTVLRAPAWALPAASGEMRRASTECARMTRALNAQVGGPGPSAHGCGTPTDRRCDFPSKINHLTDMSGTRNPGAEPTASSRFGSDAYGPHGKVPERRPRRCRPSRLHPDMAVPVHSPRGMKT